MTIASLIAVLACSPLQGQSNGVPKLILDKLGNGVNITRWLGYVNPSDQAYFKSYMKAADYANFKQLGVTFVMGDAGFERARPRCLHPSTA